MRSKHRNLLRSMPTDGSVITARELAAKLGVSVRSVKNYVSEIAAEYPELIVSTSKGYQMDYGKYPFHDEEQQENYPDTPEKRVSYMIRRILESEEPVCIADFEEEIFVGEATIRKDLPAMREKLKEFDLFVDHREGYLYINGDESNKRRMLSEIIYQEFNDNILSLSAIGQAFPGYDVGALKSLLVEVCNEQQYFINEYALINLLLDLLISIDRVKNNYLTMPTERPYHFGMREQNLAHAIFSRIEVLYNVSFNQLEVNELTLLLFGHLTKVDYRSLSLDNINEMVQPETLRIVDLIKRELETLDFLDFKNTELLLCFTVHMDNLLNRLQNDYITKNPLTEQLRSGCTFIFELAVLIAGIIKRETGYYIDQHETAYIAVHIGGMLQMQQSLRNKARCVLVFPQYYDYANKLMEQLTQTFGASLVFLGVATQAEDIKKYEPLDMVLSTIDIKTDTDAEVVFINPFLSDRDRDAVKQGLDAVIRKKKVKRVQKSLFAISSPDMFTVDKSFNNAEEAIRFMTAEMIAKGYADESFTEAVLERERSYSTAYGDVAVPHALHMNAKKTGMYVCLCDKAVPWGDTRVHIILLFSVNPDDKQTFYEVFENLIVLLLEPTNALRVAACATYASFTETILQCL